MKKIYAILITIGCLICSCKQNSTVSKAECKCIDHRFSSSKFIPIATSTIDNIPVAFCGYSSKGSEYLEEYGILKSDSSFIGIGYEVIDCSTQKSIFDEGEYYTDSIKINVNGFEIFRLAHIVNPNGNFGNLIPVIQFNFSKSKQGFQLDTLFAFPEKYFSDGYIQQVKTHIDSLENSELEKYEFVEFKMELLFLKALNDINQLDKFLNSGPYNGYLGPLFRDFCYYAKMRWENEI